MGDLQTQAIGLLDDVALNVLDKIPSMAVLIGTSLFSATVGDDVRHNYMLHYWVRPCLCWISRDATGQTTALPQQRLRCTTIPSSESCSVLNLMALASKMVAR